MSTNAEVRAAIVAKMNAVQGIGVVHDHEPYATALDKLKALYVAPGTQQLLGWFLRRESIAETAQGQSGRVEECTWRIQGVMALDEAAGSELAFDGLIEQLRDAFRADPRLGTLLLAKTPDGEPAGLQLADAGPVMFANVLCHGARLSLRTRRLVTSN